MDVRWAVCSFFMVGRPPTRALSSASAASYVYERQPPRLRVQAAFSDTESDRDRRQTRDSRNKRKRRGKSTHSGLQMH